MASYQSGWVPPTRPDPRSRPERLGTYIPLPRSGSKPSSSNRLDNEAGPGHTVEMEGRRPVRPSYGRQISLPKPTTHALSPAAESTMRSGSASAFGFRRPMAPSPSSEVGPILKKKHSRKVLRRKPSVIAEGKGANENIRSQGDATPSITWPAMPNRNVYDGKASTENEQTNEYFTTTSQGSEILPRIIPELDRYRPGGEYARAESHGPTHDVPYRLATQDLPPPTPLSSALSSNSRYSGYSGNSGNSGYSASPTTRYSESPGPGAYSRDTTPTSISSQSPGVVAPLRMTPRLRQTSPVKTRPPVTRRRMGSGSDENELGILDTQGLPSLRESLTSSSSNSTVKGNERADKKAKDKKKKKRLSPLPPSPPPRKSSQKFKSPSSSVEASPSKASKSPARPVMAAAAEVTSPKNIPPQIQSSPVTLPPRRPSRDGTPDLQGQLEEPVTIIQSNLAGIHVSSDKRRSGIAIPRGTGQSPRPALQSSLPSRNYSPIPVQREATPAPAGLGIIPDLRPANPSQSRQSPGLRTPSPSTATGKSRFGLFRRNKTAPESSTIESKEKTLRKGPAAGTGHEGYGRYAIRGRPGGSGSRERSQSAASSSQESVSSSTHTHDPFLLDRMSPVVIAGGGQIVDNRNASSEHARPSLESKGSTSQNSSKTNVSKEESRTTLWPSALPRNTSDNRSLTSLGSKGTLDSSADDRNRVKRSSLAIRRSMHRLKSNDQGVFRLPQPISIYRAGDSPAVSSQADSFLSDETRYDGTRSAPAGRAQMPQPKKLIKRPKSPRKWNFFQRTQTSNSSKLEPKAVLPVVIALAPEKPVAYYTMMDSSEAEGDEPMNIEDILREADILDLSRVESDPRESSDYRSPLQQEPARDGSSGSQSGSSNAIPAPLLSSPSRVQTKLLPTDGDSSKDPPTSRPSRLAQVGRIPRVVTARPQQTSPKSFSRPFARISMTPPSPHLGGVDRQSIAVGPSPERSPSPPLRSETATSADIISSVADSTIIPKEDQEQSFNRDRAFLVVSPRKNSETTTSSSSGVLSSYVSTTAVVPEAGAALEEDEVWDEYDDLINDGSQKVPPSATSSHGMPFQYEGFESRAVAKKTDHTTTTPTIDYTRAKSISKPLRLALTSSSIYNPDLSTVIKDALALPTPTTPMSFTDFFSGYGDRNNSVINSSGGTRRRSSSVSNRERPASANSKSASIGEVSRKSVDSRLMTITEHANDSPISQVNLRVGSMTVSKWLTFGHVLFSPAREEIMQVEEARHHSVLVVDGLGNDDWSFYAAETYPSATFYNLSSTPSRSGVSRHSSNSFPQTPENHRQVQYHSNLDKFPFPRDFFTAVVLRFPSASAEAALRNLISEGKRVLKPSGYLEMSILDLDMMNMGNRSRRAVRNLKVRISVADPSLSLASASDTVLRMVGKRGFHDIKSCNVGIPVASTVSSKTTSGKGSPEKDHEISLADMMKDESSAGDECITKMVAKVGRWWYMRCYETSVLPNGDVTASIFSDSTLLRECEKWNTSFKLLVCHAQKPVVPRRRTASV